MGGELSCRAIARQHSGDSELIVAIAGQSNTGHSVVLPTEARANIEACGAGRIGVAFD